MPVGKSARQTNALQDDASLTDEIPVQDIDETAESGEVPGALPDEDDDNAYQESDAALPDDLEEKAINRNPSKEGGHFDEV